jgi:6-phosphogluconolactonase
VAQDLFAFVRDGLNAGETLNIALTGGTVGIAALAAAKELPFNDLSLDRLHIWWGDERYVESTSSDRNALQAKNAWLSKLNIPVENIHEFPSTDEGVTAVEAAKQFEEQFAMANITFDIMLMGMGPDGHIASIFPGLESVAQSEFVFAELNSPKPPKERLSFSYKVINSARQIWFTVAGADKADAVNRVFSETEDPLPAGRVQGEEKTVWYIDQTAGNLVWGC